MTPSSLVDRTVPRRWRQKAPPKRWCLSTKLHGITSQKTVMLHYSSRLPGNDLWYNQGAATQNKVKRELSLLQVSFIRNDSHSAHATYKNLELSVITWQENQAKQLHCKCQNFCVSIGWHYYSRSWKNSFSKEQVFIKCNDTTIISICYNRLNHYAAFLLTACCEYKFFQPSENIHGFSIHATRRNLLSSSIKHT